MRETHKNNIERTVSAWLEVLEIALELQGKTEEEFLTMRKAYENKRSSKHKDVRKTVQRYFSLGRAIIEGELKVPALTKFDGQFTSKGKAKNKKSNI